MIQSFPGQTAVYISSPYGKEHSCKKLEKSLERFSRNILHGLTDQRTIRTLPSTDVENCNVLEGPALRQKEIETTIKKLIDPERAQVQTITSSTSQFSLFFHKIPITSHCPPCRWKNLSHLEILNYIKSVPSHLATEIICIQLTYCGLVVQYRHHKVTNCTIM